MNPRRNPNHSSNLSKIIYFTYLKTLNEEVMCPGGPSSTGFSLWIFVLASTKPHRLKHVLPGTELLPRARDQFVHFVHARF